MHRHDRVAALLLILPFLPAGCGGEGTTGFQGYVEGEYLRIAAPEAGWLESLSVARGQTVPAGAPLFALDATRQKAELAQARAELAKAESQLADLRVGSRPEEVAAVEAQVAEARAAARYADSDLERQRSLAQRDVAAQAKLDQALSAQRQAAARVTRAEADLAVARLPARADRIAAAEAAVESARAAVAQADWKLAQRTVASPAAGLVEETVRRVGEWVPANGTVVSLLPPAAIKVVAFVPEPQRARVRPGDRLPLGCDGCPQGLAARITWVASEAEYTPPVIYSLETRAKLVYRVEAAVDGATLLPGQPVTLTASPLPAGAP